MIHPSRDEFIALAATYTVVPVWRELLADLTTPVAAFARIAGEPRSFLLESVEHAERWGRWSFIGRNPAATLIARGDRITVEGQVPPGTPLDRGILPALESLLGDYRAPDLPGLPPLHGGLVGYLGYDVVREVERLEKAPPDDLGYPDAIVSVVGQIAAYDYWRQRVALIDSVVVAPGTSALERGALYDAAIDRLDAMAAQGAQPDQEPLIAPPEADDELPPVTRRTQADSYRLAVEAAKEHILAGDI
ncbi:MAG: anthranilate synthase component I, partial [Acidimicrobiales bacterium]